MIVKFPTLKFCRNLDKRYPHGLRVDDTQICGARAYAGTKSPHNVFPGLSPHNPVIKARNPRAKINIY